MSFCFWAWVSDRLFNTRALLWKCSSELLCLCPSLLLGFKRDCSRGHLKDQAWKGATAMHLQAHLAEHVGLNCWHSFFCRQDSVSLMSGTCTGCVSNHLSIYLASSWAILEHMCLQGIETLKLVVTLVVLTELSLQFWKPRVCLLVVGMSWPGRGA